MMSSSQSDVKPQLAQEEDFSEESSFDNSYEKSKGAAEVTLQQLASAKETFSELEVTYQKFKVELEGVREEHKLELNKLKIQIDNLTKQKSSLEDQLCEWKGETKKYQEDSLCTKRQLAETEWENESLTRELTSSKSIIEKMKVETENLEMEIRSLKLEVSSVTVITSSKSTAEQNDLDVAKQEIEQLECKYNSVLQEKESLHEDLSVLQCRLADTQADYEKAQRDLHSQSKTCNVKVSKAELQINNITKQRETLRVQLEETRMELKKSKASYQELQREMLDYQQKATIFKEELSAKTRQVETLEISNRNLDSKFEGIKHEFSKQQLSAEMLANRKETTNEDIQLSQSKIHDLESSLQSTRTEKDEMQHEMFVASSKLMNVEESYQRSMDKIRDLEKQIATARENTSRLESELFAHRSKNSQLEATYSQLKLQVKDLVNQLDAANSRVAQIEAKYEQTLHETDEYREHTSLADRKVAELTALLQKAEDSNNELDLNISSMKSQMWKFEGQMGSNSKQKSQLKIELDEERAKTGKLKKELVVTQSRYSEYQRSMDWYKRESAAKEKTSEDLRKAIGSYDEKIEGLYEEISTLQARLEVAEEEKRDLHEETLLAQKRVKEVEADNKLSNEEKDRMNTEIQSFYKRTSEIQASYNVCEHEKNDIQHQLMLLQQKVSKYEAEREESMKLRTSLEVQMEEMNSSTRKNTEDITVYKRQFDEQQHLIEEYRSDITEKNTEIDLLREKLVTQTVEVETTQSELSHVRSLYEGSERDKNNFSDQLILKNEEFSRVNVMYETILKRKEQLEKDIVVAQKKATTAEAFFRKGPDANLMKELEYERARAMECQRQLSNYKSKIQSLQSQTEISMKDIYCVADDLEQAEDKISTLQFDLERSVDERNEGIQKVATLQKMVDDLEKEALSNSKQKENAEDEVHAMKVKITKSESTIEMMHKQRAHLKDQLDKLNNNIIAYKEQIMRLESRVTEETKINESLNKVINRKEEMVNGVNLKMRAYENEMDKMKQELLSYRISCEGIKAEKEECERRCASYQEKIRELEKETFQLRETKITKEQEMSTQKFKITSIEGQIENCSKDRDHYKKEYGNIQLSIRKAKEVLISTKNQLREKERVNEICMMEISERNSTIERLRSSKIALETELISVKTDTETMRYNFEHGQERIKDLEFSLEEATMSISRLDATINSFNSESDEKEIGDSYDTKYFEVEALYKQAQDREQKLKQDIKEYKSKITKTETELKSAQHQHIELNHEINVLNRKVHEWEVSQERFEREKKELRAELMTANSMFCDLEVKYEYECRERSSLATQLEDFRMRGTSNREELLKLEYSITEQRLILEEAKREINEKEYYIKQLKEDKLYLEEQIHGLKISLDESHQDNEKIKYEQGSLQQEILSLRTSNSDHEARIEKSILARDRLQVECHNNMMKITSLEHQIVELNREKDSLYENIEEWKETSDRHRVGGIDSEKVVADFQIKIGFLKLELSKKDTVIQDLRDSKVAFETDLESTRRGLKRAEGDYASVLDQKKDLELKYKSMVTKSSETNVNSAEEYKMLQEENVVLRRKSSELESNYKISLEKEKELQGRVIDISTEVSKWKSQYDTITERKTELETDILSIQKEYAPLKEVHDSSVYKLDSVESELHASINKIAQLELQLEKVVKSKAQLEYQHQQQVLKSNSLEDDFLKAQRKLQETQILLEHKSKADTNGSVSTIEQLNIEKKGLEKNVFMLRKELTELRNAYNTTRRGKDEVEKELFMSKTQTTELNVKLRSYQEQNEELNKELLASQRKIGDAEEELQKSILEKSAHRTKREETNGKLRSCKDECTMLQREMVIYKASLETYKKEIMDKDSDEEKSKSMINFLQEQTSNLKLKIESLRDDYERSQREVAIVKVQIQEKATKISEHEHSLRLVRQDNDKFQYEIAACRSSVSEYKNYYNTSQREVEKYQMDIISMNQKISHLEAHNLALEGEKERHRNEYVILKKTISDAKSQIDVLQHEMSKLQTEISIAKKRYTEIQTSHQEEKPDVKIEALTSPRKRFEEIECEYQLSLEKNKELLIDVRELKQKVTKMEGDCTDADKIKQILEYEVQWRTRKIEELQESVKSFHEHGKGERDEIIKWQTRLTSNEQELQAAKSKIARLEDYTNSYTEKIRNMTKEMGILQEKAVQEGSTSAVSQERIEAQQRELMAAFKKISDIETSYDEVVQHKNEAIRETSIVKFKLISLEEELQVKVNLEGHLNEQTKELKSINDNLKEEISRFKIKLNEQQQAYDTNVRHNTEQRYSMESMTTENTVFESEIEVLREELASVKNQYDKAMIDSRDLNFQLKKYQLQVSEWETNYNLIKNDNDQLRTEYELLQSSYLKLEADKAGTEANTDVSNVPQDYDTDMASLRLDCEHLKNKIASLENMTTSLKESYKNVSHENAKLEDLFVASQESISSLEHTNRGLVIAKNKMQQTMEISQKKIEEFKSEIEFVRNENDTLQIEYQALKSKLFKVESDHNATLNQKQEIKKEASSSFQRLGFLETEYNQNQQMEKELQQEIVSAQKRASTLEYELKTTREKLMTSETFHKTLKEKIASMHKEITMYKETITELEVSFQNSNAKSSELAHKVSVLEQQIAKTSITGKISREGAYELEFEVTTLRSRIANLEVDLEKANTERYDNCSQLEKSKKTVTGIERYRKDITEKEIQIEELKGEKKKLLEDNENLIVEVRQLQLKDVAFSKVNSYDKENKEITLLVQQLLRDKDRLEEHILFLRREVNKKESLMDITVDPHNNNEHFHRDNRERENYFGQLRVERDEYHKSYPSKGVRHVSAHMESHAEALHQEIREKDFIIDQLRSEKIRFQGEIESLRRNIVDVKMENQRNFSISLERYTEVNSREIKEKEFIIQQLRDEKMKVEKEIDSMKQEMMIIKSECQINSSIELQGHIESHRKEIMEKEYLVTQLRSEKASFEKQVDSLKYEINFMKSEQDKHVSIEIESQKEGYRKEMREKEYLIEQLRAERITFEGQIESLRHQISYIESEKENNITVYLESQTEGHRREIKEKEFQIEQLRNERKTFEETIESMRMQIVTTREESQKSISFQIESCSEGYKREIKQKELIIQQLYSERTKEQSDIEGLRREIVVLQNDNQKHVTFEVEKRVEIYRSEIMKKETLIQQLRSEVMKYQCEVESLKQEISAIQYKSEYDISIQVERRVESLRQEIRERESTIGNMKNEISTFNTRLNSLQREVEYKMSIIEGYSTEIETLRNDRMKLETNIGMLRRENTSIKSESEKAVMIQLYSHTENHRKEIMEKEYLITQLHSEKASFENQVESLKHQISIIETENEKNVSIHVETQTENYKKEIRERDYLIETLRTEKMTYERQMETFKSQITTIKSENEKNVHIFLESNAEGYKREIKEKEDMIEQLRSERARFEEQIEFNRQEVIAIRTESQKNISLQIEYQTEVYKKEIKQKELFIQQLYEEQAKFQSEIESLRCGFIVFKNDSQKNVTIEVEKRVEIYRSEIMEKEAFIQQQRSEMLKLQGEIESMKHQMTVMQSKRDSRVEGFREEVRERETTIESLKADIISHRAQVDSLKREVEYKMNIVKGYSTEVESIRAEREKVENENRQLRSEITMIKNESEKTIAIQLQSSTESHRKELMEKEYLIAQRCTEQASLEKRIESFKCEIMVIKSENEKRFAVHLESRTANYKREIREKEYLIEQLRAEKASFEKHIESLREQIVIINSDYDKKIYEVKSENEKSLSIYLESNTAGLNREIKEKNYLIEQFRTEKAKLEEKVESFRQQIITVRQESQKTVSIQLESYSEGYKKEIAQQQSQIHQLYSEKSTLQAEIESLRRDVILVKDESQRNVTIEVEKRVEVYRAEIIEKQALIQNLRSEVIQFQSNLESLKQEMTVMYSKNEHQIFVQVESKVEDIRKEVREREVAIGNLTAENVSLKAQIDSLKREAEYKMNIIQGYTTEIETLRTERIKLERDVGSLRNDVIAIKSESEKNITIQLHCQTENFRKEIMEKEYLITQLRSEKESYKNQVGTLKHQISMIESENEKNVSIHVETQTGNYKKEIRERDYLIETLRTEKATSERHIETMRNQITNIKLENEKSMSIFLESNTEGYKREIKEKEDMIEQLRLERTKFEERIESLRQEIVEIRTESVKKVFLQIESHTETFKKEIFQKESFIQALYQEKATLQGEIESLRREMLVFKSDSQKNVTLEVEKRVEIYRTEIMEKETLIQQLRSEILKFKKEVESAKQEVTVIQSKTEYNISTEVERRVEGLRQEIRDRDVTIGNIRAETRGFHTQIDTLNRDLEYKISVIQGYGTQIETLRSERSKLESTIGSLRNEVTTIKSESEKTVMIQLYGQTENHRKEIMEKEYLITQFRSERASFENQVESLKHQISIIETENEKNVSIHVETQTENYKKEIRERDYLIETLRTEKMTYERQMETFKSQITTIKSENEKNMSILLESNAEGYKREIKEKEYLIEQSRSERVRFEEQIEHLRQEIIVVRTESEKNVSHQIDLHAESYKKEISQKGLFIQELYSEKATLQGEIESLRRGMLVFKNESQKNVALEVEKRVEMYRNEVMEKESLIQKFRSDLMKFESEIAFMKQEMSAMESKNEHNISIQVEYQTESIKKDVREREVTIESLNAEMLHYKAEIASLKQHQRSSQSVNDGYMLEIERLKKEVSSSQYEKFLIESMKHEHESLKLRYEELNKEKEAILKARYDIEQELSRSTEKLMTSEMHAKSEFQREILEYQTKVSEADQKYQMVLLEKKNAENDVDSRIRREAWEKQESINRLEKETQSLKQELEIVRRELVGKESSSKGYLVEISKLKQVYNNLSYQSGDHESMKMKYEDVCRDKEMLMKDKFRVDYELDAAKAKITELESREKHGTSTRQDVIIYQDKFTKLESDYNLLVIEKTRLEGEIENRVKQEVWKKQETIYRLEKEIRELKSENQSYNQSNDEKNALISELRMKIANLQSEIEKYKKEVYFKQTNERTEMQVKDVFEPEYKQPTSSCYSCSYTSSVIPVHDIGSTASYTSHTSSGTNSSIFTTSTPKLDSKSPTSRATYVVANDVDLKTSYERDLKSCEANERFIVEGSKIKIGDVKAAVQSGSTNKIVTSAITEIKGTGGELNSAKIVTASSGKITKADGTPEKVVVTEVIKPSNAETAESVQMQMMSSSSSSSSRVGGYGYRSSSSSRSHSSGYRASGYSESYAARYSSMHGVGYPITRKYF